MACGIRAALRPIFKRGATSPNNYHHTNYRDRDNDSELHLSPARPSIAQPNIAGQDSTAASTKAVPLQKTRAYANRLPIATRNNRLPTVVHGKHQPETTSRIATPTNATGIRAASRVLSNNDFLLTLGTPTYLKRMPIRNASNTPSESQVCPAEPLGLHTPPHESDDVRVSTRSGTAMSIITPPSTAGSSIEYDPNSVDRHEKSDSGANKQPDAQLAQGTAKVVKPASHVVPSHTGDIKEAGPATPPRKGCRYFANIPISSRPITPTRKGSRFCAPRPCTPPFPRKKITNNRLVTTSIDPLLIDAYRATIPVFPLQPVLGSNSAILKTPNRSTGMAPISPGFNPSMTPRSHIKHRNAATMSFRRFVGHNRKKTHVTEENFIRRGNCCELEGGEETPTDVQGVSEDSDDDDEDAAFFESLSQWVRADKKNCMLAKFDLKPGSDSPTERLAARAAMRYMLDSSDEDGDASHSVQYSTDEESLWEQDWDTSAELDEEDFEDGQNAGGSWQAEESVWEEDWDSDGDGLERGEAGEIEDH